MRARWALALAVGLVVAVSDPPAQSQVPPVALPVDADKVDGFDAAAVPTAGALLALDDAAKLPLSALPACASGQVLRHGADGWACDEENVAAIKAGVPSGTVELSTSGTTIRTLTVAFPRDGFAMITSQATIPDASGLVMDLDLFENLITHDSWEWAIPGANDDLVRPAQSHVTVLPVTAGSHTYKLVGSVGFLATGRVQRAQLIVAFFPAGLQ